jgi:4-carboxymuconolactone decarboxylase
MSNRLLLAAAVLQIGCSVAVAQQPRELNLRGDRFPPLQSQRLSEGQRAMIDDLLAGARTSLDGPFNTWLRSPEMGNLAQNLGEYLRYRTSIPLRLNEMAILMTAKLWSSQYEWVAHKAAALRAGLSEDVIADIHAGRRPARMQPDEVAVYDFVTELRQRRRVSDAAFKSAVATLGEQGVVDLIGVLGYYDLVSMTLNVDRYPLAGGVPAPFPEPR